MTISLWAVRLHATTPGIHFEDDTFSVESGTQPAAIKKAMVLANEAVIDAGYSPAGNYEFETVFANKISDGVEDNGIHPGNVLTKVQLKKGISKEHLTFGAAASVTRQGLINWMTGQTEDFNQKCQAMLYQICKAFGSAPVIYGSAELAKAATGLVSNDPNSAPLGTVGFAKLGTAGHVMISLGGGAWGMGSAHASHWFNAARHTGWSTWAEYRAATGAAFYGWGYTDGRNTVSVVPDAVAGPTPTQRQAGKAGSNARPDPSTNQPEVVAGGIKPGVISDVAGWLHGQVVAGNDVWFKISSYWFWSGGFTDAGTHDLADLNPVVVPPPVVTPPLWSLPVEVPPVVTPPVVVPPVVTPTPQTVTVTFDSQGGAVVPPETINAGTVALKPVDPKLAGSTFGGWYSSETQLFDFSQPVTADTKLVAKWVKIPVVVPPVTPTDPNAIPTWFQSFLTQLAAFFMKFLGKKK